MKRKNSALRVNPDQNRLYMELVETVITALREEQRRQHLSVLGLARKVGLNETSSIFKPLYVGTRVPTFKNLVRIADALDMDIEVRVIRRGRS